MMHLENTHERIHWGILGTGNIAHQFAEDLAMLPEAELWAVGSRKKARANAFGDMFHVPYRYASYEELAQDPLLDVVYVATPHPFHYEHTMLALRAGKSVLCEKPFALNAVQASEMTQLAKQKGLFLMEAMWTRFIPAIVRVRALLQEGAIGEPRLFTADLGFANRYDPSSRFFDPALGGGALLDLGVYPISMSSMVFGRPQRASSLASFAPTGVDRQSGYVFTYPDGQLAVLHSSLDVESPSEAELVGTTGTIHLDKPMHHPQRIVLRHRIRTGKTEERFDLPFPGNGYQFEAQEVMRCLREGLLEAPAMPLHESLEIMQTMDAIREQWGLHYPGEEIPGERDELKSSASGAL